jgi:nucleoside-diphosphate-sugar epimerase
LKLLITGGAGFIGSHLVERLVADGHEVAVLDDFSAGKDENLKQIGFDSLKLVKADINDRSPLLSSMDGVETIVHLAAIVSVQRSITNPAFTTKVNVGGTLSVLECARKSGVKKVVFASSAAVYGDSKLLPIKEEFELSPISPYGASKLDAEKKILEFQKEFGLDATILRFFNVYGPRSYGGEYSGVIAKFAARLSRHEGPVIFGDGQQTRDFVFVDDVVQALVLASEQNQTKLHSVFNVGSGSHVSIEDLATLESRLVLGKVLIPFEYRSAIDGDIRHSYADISRIRKELGYEPKTNLEDGLKKYLSWLLPYFPGTT